mgnify:CR=1 FL=1
MMKIGLISDTHNYLDPQTLDYFSDCDEIWHAGDFGTIKIAEQLKEVAPVVGVYGNIDGQDIRSEYPLHQRFICEGVDVWMTHIGGIPGDIVFLFDRRWRITRLNSLSVDILIF